MRTDSGMQVCSIRLLTRHPKQAVPRLLSMLWLTESTRDWLDKDTFLPILVKGWNAQVSAVDADGKLGYVQPIGADPKKVTRNMTEVYGVGAFLMGGCEIYKMAR